MRQLALETIRHHKSIFINAISKRYLFQSQEQQGKRKLAKYVGSRYLGNNKAIGTRGQSGHDNKMAAAVTISSNRNKFLKNLLISMNLCKGTDAIMKTISNFSTLRTNSQYFERFRHALFGTKPRQANRIAIKKMSKIIIAERKIHRSKMQNCCDAIAWNNMRNELSAYVPGSPKFSQPTDAAKSVLPKTKHSNSFDLIGCNELLMMMSCKANALAQAEKLRKCKDKRPTSTGREDKEECKEQAEKKKERCIKTLEDEPTESELNGPQYNPAPTCSAKPKGNDDKKEAAAIFAKNKENPKTVEIRADTKKGDDDDEKPPCKVWDPCKEEICEEPEEKPAKKRDPCALPDDDPCNPQEPPCKKLGEPCRQVPRGKPKKK